MFDIISMKGREKHEKVYIRDVLCFIIMWMW